MEQFHKILNSFYREYDFDGRLLRDPIEFPRRYKETKDIEAAGFIASCLAYGKVDLFKPVVEKILSVMGTSPHDYLLNISISKVRKQLGGLKYRFNEHEDILALLFILHKAFSVYGSLENLFMKHFKQDDPNIGNGLAGMMSTLLSVNTSSIYHRDIRPFGLQQLFPSPVNGSACKRSNLFLRWMVRDRDIDLGIWKQIPKNKLVIPLDTHIARISRCLRFTTRKPQDWKTAVEITEALKRFDPDDPLKYDFALCHHGISGTCKGEADEERCGECVFGGAGKR